MQALGLKGQEAQDPDPLRFGARFLASSRGDSAARFETHQWRFVATSCSMSQASRADSERRIPRLAIPEKRTPNKCNTIKTLRHWFTKLKCQIRSKCAAVVVHQLLSSLLVACFRRKVVRKAHACSFKSKAACSYPISHHDGRHRSACTKIGIPVTSSR